MHTSQNAQQQPNNWCFLIVTKNINGSTVIQWSIVHSFGQPNDSTLIQIDLVSHPIVPTSQCRQMTQKWMDEYRNKSYKQYHLYIYYIMMIMMMIRCNGSWIVATASRKRCVGLHIMLLNTTILYVWVYIYLHLEHSFEHERKTGTANFNDWIRRYIENTLCILANIVNRYLETSFYIWICDNVLYRNVCNFSNLNIHSYIMPYLKNGNELSETKRGSLNVHCIFYHIIYIILYIYTYDIQIERYWTYI